MKAFKLGLKVAAVASLSALLSVSAMAGIENSKHDLRGTNSASTGTVFTDATEICAFCHTPHGSNVATAAPLWNRLTTGTQSAYTSSTLDGTAVLTGSPSLACLSCHDGTQAMNTVINAPSDASGYNASGSVTAIGTASTNPVSAFMADNVAKLTGDLRNDHPVAVPYAGGAWSSFAGGLTPSQADFLTAGPRDIDFNAPSSADINGKKWWVEAEGTANTNRSKSDLILYNRSGAEAGVGYVECATCHDPHAGEKQSFLRMGSNNNSQVCLACHIK